MDRAQYPMYRNIMGEWEYPDFKLIVDYVQSDPFAPPSRCRVRVPITKAGFEKDLHSNKIRTIAMCDYLTRMFWKEAHMNEAVSLKRKRVRKSKIQVPAVPGFCQHQPFPPRNATAVCPFQPIPLQAEQKAVVASKLPETKI